MLSAVQRMGLSVNDLASSRLQIAQKPFQKECQRITTLQDDEGGMNGGNVYLMTGLPSKPMLAHYWLAGRLLRTRFELVLF